MLNCRKSPDYSTNSDYQAILTSATQDAPRKEWYFMKLLLGSFIGLVLSVSVGAESLLEGHVRRVSGQPVADAQVRLFDLTDVRRFVGTTTDETGHFSLLPQSFSGGTALPAEVMLEPNYPNPFNPATRIPYQLPASTHVRLEVFNVLGQRLATLVDGEQSAGRHMALWDGTDASGRAVGAGVYIYRLIGGGQTVSRRMVLVDGQAGIPSGGAHSEEASSPVYGLTVSSSGSISYVNPGFRVGVDEANIVLEESGGLPRQKRATGGVLGDVDNDGQVDVSDVLYLLIYIMDDALILPTNGDLSLGDVNRDGTIDLADVLLLVRYTNDPSDPALPVGIGEVLDDHGDTRSKATEVSLGSSTAGSLSSGDVDYFRIEIRDAGTLSVSTTGNMDTYGSILDSSGDILISNDDSGPGYNFQVSVSVRPGTYYILVAAYDELTTGDYTLEVPSYVPDRVTNVIKLTQHDASDWSPTWSPDGRRIAFMSYRDGDPDIYVMDDDGTNLTNLTQQDGDYQYWAPAWSPDGRRIAFMSDLSDRDGDPDIYVMDDDGTNLTNLTQHDASDWGLAWSPDGRRIAFMSDRDGNTGIYVMDDDGTNLTKLTQHDASDSRPAWSPDGRRIAFRSDRDGNYGIYVMDDDGTNLTKLTQHASYYWDPVWSPDGRRIAFMAQSFGNNNIYVMDDDGTNLTNLTQHAVEGEAPAWSPNSRHIAFISNSDIYVTDTDGIKFIKLIQDAVGGFYGSGAPAWSPDGRRIAFVSRRDGNRNIYVMDADGIDLTNDGIYFTNPNLNLTQHAASDWDPAWSPDGRRIAFMSDRDGNTGIYVMDDDGTNLTKLTQHDASDWDPAWSPDGRRIAFRSDRDGNYGIYVMDDDGTNLTKLTQHEVWAGWSRAPAWSPDGRRIAFAGSRDDNIDIYVVDDDGTNLTKLTDLTKITRSEDSHRPLSWWPSRLAWSPDGRRIAFVLQDRYGVSNTEIYVMDDDGTNLTKLIQQDASDWNPAWSPDGRRIAFVSNRDGNTEIYVMDDDGTNLTKLTQQDGDYRYWGGLAWSPDGRRIAFVLEDRYGVSNTEIYVMDDDGTNLTNLTQHAGWDETPVWSPDGRRIAFVSDSSGYQLWDIYVMDID